MIKTLIKFSLVILPLTVFSQAVFAQNPFTEENVNSRITTCEQGKSEINNFCAGNPDYDEEMATAGFWDRMKSGLSQGAAEESRQNVEGQTVALQMSLRKIKAACSAAKARCHEACQLQISNNMPAAYATPSNPTALQLVNDGKTTKQLCTQESQAFNAKEGAAQMNIAEMMMALAAIAQAFGLGQGGGVDASGLPSNGDGDEDDECSADDPNAKNRLKCKTQSDPKGTRAGLKGLASLNGKPGGGLSGLLGAGEDAGEPGGESQDAGGGGGAAGGFGSSGAGGFGGGSASGSTLGAGAEKGEGFDTDIHKGSYSAGYGSGGGGGGGGSSGGRPSFGGVPKLGNFNAAGAGKAALNKKLKDFKSQARMPASKGGANGPFEDNWSVVNKAYKKNSGTMYNQ